MMMTGSELKTIRLELGLTLGDFGRLLGFGNTPHSHKVSICEMESGRRVVSARAALLAQMYARHGVPVRLDKTAHAYEAVHA
jgi:hypothetical protein